MNCLFSRSKFVGLVFGMSADQIPTTATGIVYNHAENGCIHLLEFLIIGQIHCGINMIRRNKNSDHNQLGDIVK